MATDTVGVRTEVWLVATPPAARAEAMAAAAADPAAAAVGIV